MAMLTSAGLIGWACGAFSSGLLAGASVRAAFFVDAALFAVCVAKLGGSVPARSRWAPTARLRPRCEKASRPPSPAADVSPVAVPGTTLGGAVCWAVRDGRALPAWNECCCELGLKEASVRPRPAVERGLPVKPMNAIQSFLASLGDPMVAYLLLVFGLSAVLFEVTAPGHVLPGAFGAVATLVALLGLFALGVNFFGVVLIGAGFGLLFAEALQPGFGLFGAAGLFALLVGSIIA